MKEKRIFYASDASGAERAARAGLAVLVVDLIDMSTTLECALEAGALAVWGASPDGARPPVTVNPEQVGILAGRQARELGAGVVLVAEPRVGSEAERLERCGSVVKGLAKAGASLETVFPNLGRQTAALAEFQGRVVIAVTESGGVAFDAALQAGGTVATGTVARTLQKKGREPALVAARRALRLAEGKKGVAVVAASSNAWEDVLAARFIAGLARLALAGYKA